MQTNFYCKKSLIRSKYLISNRMQILKMEVAYIIINNIQILFLSAKPCHEE